MLLGTCFAWCPTPRPQQALLALSGRPPDVSHLLGAHQEANRLASTAVGGRGSDVAVGGAGGAGRAVASEAGQRVRGAVVLGQLSEVLLSPLETKLHGEKRLELQPLDGAQKDHGVWGRTETTRRGRQIFFQMNQIGCSDFLISQTATNNFKQ